MEDPILRERFQASHEGITNTDNRGYIINWRDASYNFDHMERNILLTGHTHKQTYFTDAYGVVFGETPEGVNEINDGTKVIINPGSVGQPRDGDPRASYCIFDDNEMTFEFRRVHYDIDKVVRHIEKTKKSGLRIPVVYARRLYNGT